MSAVVTDQFRISNAGNFVDSVLSTDNSYYVFLGLSNPTKNPGFGRTDTWNTTPPNPVDNFQYEWQDGSTSLFGKKINSQNIRRVIRKVDWVINLPYDMYRQDYSSSFNAPISSTARLYDSNYYVVTSDYNVYICIENGSYGAPGSITAKGKTSKFEPTSTDLEPFSAGNDDYVWKYLYTISPSDIVKFDSTEYIVVPNDWETSTNSQIQNVREAGDSSINFNQIKTVYREAAGLGYQTDKTETCNILGDGSGGKVSVTTNTDGAITSVTVTAGGTGYTYGIIDLSPIHKGTDKFDVPAKLIPIIPPSRGHGYDIYKELGADRVLVYARFDDSTKDFPTNSAFAQVGIVKNPKTFSAIGSTFTGTQYSSLNAIKLSSTLNANVSIGTTITQSNSNGTASGYLASYDKQTKVIKFYQDRSLYFNETTQDQTDYSNVATQSKKIAFSGANSINFDGPSPVSVDTSFSGISIVVNDKTIDLGVTFTDGYANPEINKTSGDIIYIDNRKLVERDSRQKEDIKIILEF